MPVQLEEQACLILAGGAGCVKVFSEVAFKPMPAWVIDAARGAGVRHVGIATSQAEEQPADLNCERIQIQERFETGKAVACARAFLQLCGIDTLVLNGNAPFIAAESIRAAYRQHVGSDNAATAIGVDGACGYWFRREPLLELLADDALKTAELPQLSAALSAAGQRTETYLPDDRAESRRAHSAKDLLELNELAAARILERHLENDVQFISRDGIVIGPDVQIEAGARVLPGCLLSGKTVIGSGCVIGPNTVLRNTTVAAGAALNQVQAADSSIGEDTTIGPYCQLRPGSHIGPRVKIGDFVEIKNSTIGEGTAVSHLTYIGDADVGSFCNFGCGVVFVNYDGQNKNRTVVGDYAFIGCNTNLVAPVTVGKGAYTGAGTTITENVPDGALAIGRVPQQNRPEWARKKLDKYIEKKSRKS